MIPEITKAGAERLLGEELERAEALVPVEDWANPFAYLRWSHAKSQYGSARVDGTMTLSRTFLGTDAWEDLRDTIRHELAHLIAGVSSGHGRRWRQWAEALGCLPQSRVLAKSAALREAKRGRWLLVAITLDGRETPLRWVHKRDPRRLRYFYNAAKPHHFYRLRACGSKVLCFEYREGGEAEPCPF